MTPSPPVLSRRINRRALVTFAIVGVTMLWLVWTMSPWAWFVDTTPTGGDMGAHVWSPKFLREELLPNFRLTGWSPDWYAGFPAFTFYMIIPSLAIVMVNVGIEFSIGPLDIDLDFYAFVGALAVAGEITRRLRLSASTRLVVLAAVASSSIALSWRYDGRTMDPKNLLRFWSPLEPFTFNDTSLDLLVVAIALPIAVGSYVFFRAESTGRWRWLITTAAVIATILVVPVPYGVAMKLIAISGIITLPLAAWATGRLAGLAFPGPALLAVFTLPFLFDRSFNIYGGNIMSTMAGEFAYSMGLSIAVLYIGVVIHSIHSGRHRGLAAGLLALAGLTHLFAAFFAIVVTVAILVTRPGWQQFVRLTIIGPLAGLLAAFWVMPFYWNSPYLNDMGWGKERDYVGALWSRGGAFGGHLFLENSLPLQVFIVLAVISAVICAIRRVRLGIILAITAVIFAIGFFLLPETRLWNVRVLPFYYLSVYLLSGVGVSEMCRMGADFLRTPHDIRSHRVTAGAGIPAAFVMVVLIVAIGLPLRSLPFGNTYRVTVSADDGTERVVDEYGIDYFELGTRELNLGPSWMRYNFKGYEQSGGSEEYRHLMVTMDRVGLEFGCGQSLWEYEGERLGTYGTPMAPMLLPHWTDGCIGSMEGLYFEASATTPYHFLLQSELSFGPSRAMRDMPYSSLDVAKGVEGLQAVGVRYYMASTEEAISQARSTPTLEEIATSGPWVIFIVEDQAVVVGLDHLPVVVDGVDVGGEEWLIPTVAWWESGKDTPLVAADGPDSWPTSSFAPVLEEEEAEYLARYEADVEVALTAGTLPPEKRAEDRVRDMRTLAEHSDEWLERIDSDVALVSNLETDTASISFDVDQIGLPVLVRASYFPNWEVAGADGPYRVAPNMMVVVPTSTHVELTYGRSGVELFSMALTFLGIALLFGMGRIAQPRYEGRLWDLAEEPLSIPSTVDLIDDVRAGLIDQSDLDAMAGELNALWGKTMVTTGIACWLGAVSLVVWSVANRWHPQWVPGGDKVLPSILVLGPTVIAVLIVMFSTIPGFVAVVRHRGAIDRAGYLLDQSAAPDVPPVVS